MAMLDVGIELEAGSGVAAAQSYWRSHAAAAAAKTTAGAATGAASKAGIAA
jgi:hypothetical protein